MQFSSYNYCQFMPSTEVMKRSGFGFADLPAHQPNMLFKQLQTMIILNNYLFIPRKLYLVHNTRFILL